MLRKSAGLSDEKDTSKHVAASQLLPKDRIVTDKMVGEAWDKAADFWYSHYNEFGDVNRRYVIDPALLKILGQVQGKRILDAGCGNGYLCRLLSKKGAKMVGVDVSERSIGFAEAVEREDPLNVEYHVGSICDLSMCNSNMFDAVVSNLVLQDLQNIDKAIRETCRVLKPDGKLVFSILHPCFSSPPVRGWVRKPVDSQRKEDWLYWKVDRYFDRTIEEWSIGYFNLPSVYSFHRPLSDYVKVLISNGFTITDFEEPIPADKDTEEHYREFGNECDRIPWFLIIGAVKQEKNR